MIHKWWTEFVKQNALKRLDLVMLVIKMNGNYSLSGLGLAEERGCPVFMTISAPLNHSFIFFLWNIRTKLLILSRNFSNKVSADGWQNLQYLSLVFLHQIFNSTPLFCLSFFSILWSVIHQRHRCICVQRWRWWSSCLCVKLMQRLLVLSLRLLKFLL